MPIYDEEKEKEYIPGSHDDMDMSDADRAAEIDQLEKDFAAPSYTGGDSKELGLLGRRGDGGLFNPDKDKGSSKLDILTGKIKNKRAAIGAAVVGIIISIVAAIMSLLPMKVLHIVNNIQQRFFASSEQATEDMTGRLFTGYIIKKVLPSIKDGKCTSTRQSKDCVAATSGDGPIAALYNGWKDARIEEKMFQNQGLEIRREGNRIFMRSDKLQYDIFSGDYDPNNSKEFDNRVFSQMNRSEARREIRRAVSDETLAKRVMYRFTYGRLIERKYGIARCLIACNTRDKVSDNIEAKKAAFKMHFISRVVMPRSEMIGLAMLCATGGFTCTDAGDTNEYGEKPSKFEKDVQKTLKEWRDAGRDKDLEKLSKDTESIRNEGTAKTYMTSKLGEVVLKTFGKGIPIVGWIDLGSRLFVGAEKLGPSVRQMNYVINAAGMVGTYSMYRSTADEMKTGNIDPDQQGSTAVSLSGSDGKERADQGGLPAEGSPLYQKMFGNQPITTALFGEKVYAESAYECNDGYLPKEGELVCPEEKLVASGSLVDIGDRVSWIANSDALEAVELGAKAWLDTGGKLFDLVSQFLAGTFLGVVPDFIKEKGEEIAKAMAEYMTDYFVNNPFSDNPSGARMVNMAIGGADVAGNDLAHYGLGAGSVSMADAEAIRVARHQERLDDFKSQNLFARLFDGSNQFSLVSRLAMVTPSSVSGFARNSVVGSLSPSKLAHFMSSPKVSAAALDKDPFGITQYAYDPKDPVFIEDPEEYWEKNKCDDEDTIKNWGEKSELNEETGMQDHGIGVSNGCKLLRRSIVAAGAIYTVKVLEPEDLGLSRDGSAGQTSATLCTMGDKRIDESSALAMSKKHEDLVYTLNDNGDSPHIYAVKLSTCETVGTFNMQGGNFVKGGTEALQIDYRKRIWLGDIGDGHPNQSQMPGGDKNDPAVRSHVTIAIADEPTTATNGSTATLPARRFNISFPNGPENSEALLVHPLTGQPYIITKNTEGRVYSIPKYEQLKPAPADNKAVLEPHKMPAWVTDATYTNDGKYILVRTVQDQDTLVFDAITWKQLGSITTPKVTQGESITMDTNGDSFVIGSEGENSPLIRVALPVAYGGTGTLGGSNGAVGAINLKDWKLTTAECDGGKAKEYRPPLDGVSNEFFKKNPDGSLLFYMKPRDGLCKTSSRTKYFRSELRELTGGDEASWSSTSGTHKMIIRQKVTKLSPSSKRHLVTGQIHGGGDDVTVFRIEDDKLYVTDGDDLGPSIGTVAVGQIFTVGFEVSGGVTKYYYSPTGEANPPLIGHTLNKSYSGAYFKAGNYYQNNQDGEAEVVILGLELTHK